ncbi:MAG: AraC family transcriptional regulator [Alphaproteobacteria bacterium]|nr:MAG: AraC family transcriptional regulator [Alphaproteobacteria bacterium]
MSDPLSDVVTLLKPRAVFAKGISGAGAWAVRYAEFGHPSFSAVLEGQCRLVVDGAAPITLSAGDFVLLPATPGFVISGLAQATPKHIDPKLTPTPTEEVRHGRQTGPADVRLLGGYFLFDSPDAALLVSLLPRLIHVSGVHRLSTLTALVGDETRADKAGRDLVLARLVDLLLIEALRAHADAGTGATAGLLRGLSDARIAAALRAMHAAPARDWTVVQLAGIAALSRSAFFDRFTRAVGVSPMDYLLAWRMALAKDLLRTRDLAIDEVAERVGYASASTFSTAFSRHVGQPPGRFARAVR